MSYYDDVYLAPTDDDGFWDAYESWEPDEDDLDTASSDMICVIDSLVREMDQEEAKSIEALAPLTEDRPLDEEEIMALAKWCDDNNYEKLSKEFRDCLVEIAYSQYKRK